MRAKIALRLASDMSSDMSSKALSEGLPLVIRKSMLWPLVLDY